MKKEDKEKCRESLKKNITILREHATARRKEINERENTEYPLSDFWEWQMANELAIISLVATHSDPVEFMCESRDGVREALERVEKEILLHGENNQFTADLRAIINFANHSTLASIAYKPQQRKYSLEELDEMRSLIANWADYWMIMKSAEVEDRLRTTMMNGTSIEEMREWAKKKEAEKDKEDE